MPPSPPLLTEAPPQRRVVRQSAQGRHQRVRITFRHQQPRDAVLHGIRDGSARGRHHGESGGHRLENCEGLPLVLIAGGEHEHVCSGQEVSLCPTDHNASQLHFGVDPGLLYGRPNPGLLRMVEPGPCQHDPDVRAIDPEPPRRLDQLDQPLRHRELTQMEERNKARLG